MATQASYRYATIRKVSLGLALIVLPAVIWLRRQKQSLGELASTQNLKTGQYPNEERTRISIDRLTNSAETLLIPLYCRAVDSQLPDSGLHDAKSLEIVNRLDYDFSRIRAKATSREGVILRAREFDRHVKEFLAQHPDGTVVEIGCGLDTRFYRVDNGSVTWLDLDFPEVIAMRQQLFDETARHRFIARSVLDDAWMDEIPAGQPVLLVAEAVFPYLAESEVKRLILTLTNRFPGSQIIFDGVPPILAAKGGRLHPILWRMGAHIGWGLGEANTLETWSRDIHLLGTYPYYVVGSKLFTGWGRFLRRFAAFFRDFKMVRYQLGDLRAHA